MNQSKTIFLLHPSDFLTDHESHGDGLTAYGFIRELASRGHRLHIAARNYSLHSTFPNNVTLHKVRTRFKYRLIHRMEYAIGARLLLRQIQKQERIDIIHQMNPVFAGLSLGMVGTKIPIVLGTIVPRWPEDPDSVIGRKTISGKLLQVARNWIVHLQQKKATLLLLTSPAAMNRIPKPDAMGNKILFVPHGIDEALFSPPRTETHSDAPPTILYLANLQKRKGIFTLLEAFREVLKSIPNCKLRIVGSGPESGTVSEYVRITREGNKIELAGNVKREHVRDFFLNTSVYCLPSFAEPFGASVLEAMSCGVPVVATAAGGIPYLVPEGGRRLVPPGDPRALASALIEVLRDKKLQARMGEANRDHVVSSLSWTRVVDRLEQAYEMAILRSGASENLGSDPTITEPLPGDLLS